MKQRFTFRQLAGFILLLAAVALAWAIGRGDTDLVASVVLVTILTLLLMLPSWLNAHARLRAYTRAARAGDSDRARKALDELRPYYKSKTGRAFLALADASLLTMDERYGEAIRILESIDPGSLHPQHAVSRDNALAWCLAHTGEAARAIELSRTTLPRASTRLRPYCHGTLGAALVRADRPREAIDELERAMKSGIPDPRAQSIRAFYLGEALRALGRTDEAAAAYERACREAPDGRWGGRAREQLDALRSATPYRV